MHKDVTGKELMIGDKVVYSDSRYANLHVGFVIGFTPQNIRVGYRKDQQRGSIKSSDQVAKVD